MAPGRTSAVSVIALNVDSQLERYRRFIPFGVYKDLAEERHVLTLIHPLYGDHQKSLCLVTSRNSSDQLSVTIVLPDQTNPTKSTVLLECQPAETAVDELATAFNNLKRTLERSFAQRISKLPLAKRDACTMNDGTSIASNPVEKKIKFATAAQPSSDDLYEKTLKSVFQILNEDVLFSSLKVTAQSGVSKNDFGSTIWDNKGSGPFIVLKNKFSKAIRCVSIEQSSCEIILNVRMPKVNKSSFCEPSAVVIRPGTEGKSPTCSTWMFVMESAEAVTKLLEVCHAKQFAEAPSTNLNSAVKLSFPSSADIVGTSPPVPNTQVAQGASTSSPSTIHTPPSTSASLPVNVYRPNWRFRALEPPHGLVSPTVNKCPEGTAVSVDTPKFASEHAPALGSHPSCDDSKRNEQNEHDPSRMAGYKLPCGLKWIHIDMQYEIVAVQPAR